MKENNLNEFFYLFPVALGSCSFFNCEWKTKSSEYTMYSKQLSLDISYVFQPSD